MFNGNPLGIIFSFNLDNVFDVITCMKKIFQRQMSWHITMTQTIKLMIKYRMIIYIGWLSKLTIQIKYHCMWSHKSIKGILQSIIKTPKPKTQIKQLIGACLVAYLKYNTLHNGHDWYQFWLPVYEVTPTEDTQKKSFNTCMWSCKLQTNYHKI